MATPTYELIESVTLATAASSVTFSSITQSYRDLVLVAAVANTTSNSDVAIQFNGDSGTSNYSYVAATGTGSAIRKNAATQLSIPLTYYCQCTTTLGEWSSIAQICDYSANDKHKTALIRSNTTVGTGGANMTSARWANTSAITSLNVISNLYSFAVGSTFNLYGIAG
jgi:hypothetical protein